MPYRCRECGCFECLVEGAVCGECQRHMQEQAQRLGLSVDRVAQALGWDPGRLEHVDYGRTLRDRVTGQDVAARAAHGGYELIA